MTELPSRQKRRWRKPSAVFKSFQRRYNGEHEDVQRSFQSITPERARTELLVRVRYRGIRVFSTAVIVHPITLSGSLCRAPRKVLCFYPKFFFFFFQLKLSGSRGFVFGYCFMQGGVVTDSPPHGCDRARALSDLLLNSAQFMQLQGAWRRSNLFQCSTLDSEDFGTRCETKMKTDTVFANDGYSKGVTATRTEREKHWVLNKSVHNMCNRITVCTIRMLYFAVFNKPAW